MAFSARAAGSCPSCRFTLLANRTTNTKKRSVASGVDRANMFTRHHEITPADIHDPPDDLLLNVLAQATLIRRRQRKFGVRIQSSADT